MLFPIPVIPHIQIHLHFRSVVKVVWIYGAVKSPMAFKHGNTKQYMMCRHNEVFMI